MSSFIYDQFGIPRKVEHLNAVERLEKLKATSGADPWPVIEECIKIWEESNPTTWKSYLFEVKQRRATRANKFASVHDKANDGYLRWTLDIPEKVMFMIRCIYDSSELDMNREFFQRFARKFPRFMIAEKI